MILPEGYAQANIRWTGTGLPTGAENVLGIDVSNSVENPGEIAVQLGTAIAQSGLLTQLVNQVLISSILVKFGPEETGDFFELATNYPGTATAGGVPANTSLLVNKITSIGGRRGRGRMYVPGLVETSVDAAGALLPAYRTGLQNCFTSIANYMANNDNPLVLLHGSYSEAVSTPTPITSLSVQPKVATQRRRLRR